MYKIFINEYPLVITANEEDFYQKGNYRLADDTEAGISGAVETLERSDRIIGNFGVMVMTDDVHKTFKRFAKPYQRISAAGGLVFNAKGELLLILRQGKWDLPKGKVDKGETVEEAAVREVQEECGIGKIELAEALPNTYHTYYLEGKKVLKTTYWFTMHTNDYATMTPQLEENITELKWVNPAELDLENLETYNSIRSLLQTALGR
ncbi:MAG: NUDIX hydrolase [Bacteroidota bacterium]|nr:NUDIX hydrolase [Bacteroidota bacterium]MDX5429487.1 NUDIX hydrolase [Bacteroidota bacterium]MDX5468274.1 NUDIX hydrolase [Bacteroidota bacterium]